MKTLPTWSLASAERSAASWALPVPLQLWSEFPKWQLIFRQASVSDNILFPHQHRLEIKRSNPLPALLLLRAIYSSILQANTGPSRMPGARLGAGYHGHGTSFLSTSSWSLQSGRGWEAVPWAPPPWIHQESPGHLWKALKSGLRPTTAGSVGVGLEHFKDSNVQPGLGRV